MSTILCVYPFAVTKKSFPTTFFIARGSIHDEYGNIGANDLVLHLSSGEQSAAMQSMTGDELPVVASSISAGLILVDIAASSIAAFVQVCNATTFAFVYCCSVSISYFC